MNKPVLVPADPQGSPSGPLGQDPERQKRMVIYSGLGAAALLILSLSFYWFIYSASHIATDNAYIETDFYSVNCRIMGYVKEVIAAENEHVKKGQTLVRLDDTDFQVELHFKEAKFKKATADLNRARSLIRSNAISTADMENAAAILEATKADLEGSQLKVRYSEIVAPIDGTIGKKNVEAGQFVQPGQSLFVIVPNDKLWVKANYKETQLEDIRPGMPVEIRVDAHPGHLWMGKVESVFPSSGARLSILPPENASGNFTKIVQRIPVKISIDTSNGPELRAGMSVTSTIVIK